MYAIAFLIILCLVLLTIVLYQLQKIRYLLKDKTTKAYNAFFFERKINRYLVHDTLFILIDVDNFKSFNTRFGYEKADYLLSMLITRISHHIPKDAVIVRYKLGDEFVIVIPHSHLGDEKETISSITHHTEQEVFTLDEKPVSLTLSVSASFFRNKDSKEALMNRLIDDINKMKIEKEKGQ